MSNCRYTCKKSLKKYNQFSGPIHMYTLQRQSKDIINFPSLDEDMEIITRNQSALVGKIEPRLEMFFDNVHKRQGRTTGQFAEEING